MGSDLLGEGLISSAAATDEVQDVKGGHSVVPWSKLSQQESKAV
jgi:hypothetical protein